MVRIQPLPKEKLPDFLDYLTLHLAENGQEDRILFQPLSRKQSVFTPELGEKFRNSLEKEIPEPGWRKLWIATDSEKILGHADIRGYQQLNADHRVLLGMGVDQRYRQQKIGEMLLNTIIEFCRQHPAIDWLDLEVLSSNFPAVQLYRKMNFLETGTIEDMFRIDGKSYNYTSMTLNVSS